MCLIRTSILMLPTTVLTVMSAALLLTAEPLPADGTYYIGRDERGLFFETDQDGSWTIGPQDRQFFRSGQRGQYRIGADSGGTFIDIDGKPKFYVDLPSRAQHKSGMAEFPEKKSNDRRSKIAVHGNHVLVPVKLDYQGRRIDTILLLDTGASMIVLHRATADRLQIKTRDEGEMASAQVAGGAMIPMQVITLDRVSLGPVTRTKLSAGIIETEGPDISFDGLLGMNFLKGLEFDIDYKKN